MSYFGRAFFGGRFFGSRYFGSAAGLAVVSNDNPRRGGGTYLTPEELERVKEYWRDIEEAVDKPRRKREELQRRVTETIRKAYNKLHGIEPEAAQEVVAAVAAVAPQAVKQPKPSERKAAGVPQAPRLDWAAVAKNVEAIERLISVIEARDTAAREAAVQHAAQQRAAYEAMLDEEDVETLLLVA
jgi:hypothetical protein